MIQKEVSIVNKAIDSIYKNERIILDGTAWESCAFHNCDIVLATGETSVKNCHFHKCKLVLEGNAVNIVSVIELFFPGKLPFNGDRPNPFFSGPKIVK